MRHTTRPPSRGRTGRQRARPAALVVEDTSVTRRIVVEQLEQLGCRARAAADGKQALAALEADAFDIVLMDCQLPGMSGRETARRIRSLESGRARQTPIVAISAPGIAGERERCLAAGMDDFLAKPVASEALEAILARWARGARATPASGGAAARAATRARLEAEIAEEYLGEAPRLRDALASALDADQLDLAAATAHDLGGISMYVAGDAVARHCTELAERARAGDRPECARCLGRIDGALRRTCARLRRSGTSAGRRA